MVHIAKVALTTLYPYTFFYYAILLVVHYDKNHSFSVSKVTLSDFCQSCIYGPCCLTVDRSRRRRIARDHENSPHPLASLDRPLPATTATET